MTIQGDRFASEQHDTSSGPQDRTLICFSHLRWDFVLQRPQHLMSRLAQHSRVLIWEEPVEVDGIDTGMLDIREDRTTGVTIATPRLPRGLTGDEQRRALAGLLDGVLSQAGGQLIAWYYTPMMLPFSRHVRPDCVVYDCMDELANFRFAPPELLDLESELLERADLVFTGGYSLYEAKRHRPPDLSVSVERRPRALRARARRHRRAA